MSELWIGSLIVLWIVVLIVAFFLIGVLRELGIIHMRLGNTPGGLITNDGLDRGAYAPDFSAREIETGRTIHLADLERRARVLVFLSPSCSACQKLIPSLNEVVRTRASEFDFVSICQGDVESCRALARLNRLKTPMVVDEGKIHSSYEVNADPFVYLLDYEGRVLVRGIVNDWEQLESFLSQEGTYEADRQWAGVEEPGVREVRDGV